MNSSKMETYASICVVYQVHIRDLLWDQKNSFTSHTSLPIPITKIHVFAGLEPLSWSSRLQIALDAARGLEYIHEHTNPAYIHRDIKSPNILLDINLRAKVKIIRVIAR